MQIVLQSVYPLQYQQDAKIQGSLQECQGNFFFQSYFDGVESIGRGGKEEMEDYCGAGQA